MVWFIFIIAVLNLLFGFGLAVVLGQRYRMIYAPGGLPSEQEVESWNVDSTPPPPEEEATEAPSASDNSKEDTETHEEPKTTEEEPSPALDATAGGADSDSGPEAPPDSATTREATPGEKVVEDCRHQVRAYHGELTRLDEQLRLQFEAPDVEVIEACLTSLRAATEKYLEGREEASQKFDEVHGETPEMADVQGELQAALARQDVQIDSTKETIEGFDYQNNLETGCRKVVDETNKLLDANHQVRDALDATMVTVARAEGRLADPNQKPARDELTRLLSREGFEAALIEWWQKDPHKVRPLSLSVLDIDHFTTLNTEHGQQVGDHILRAIGHLLAAEIGNDYAVGRISGQRFQVLFPDVDVRAATNVMERLRQLLEMVHFNHRNNDIQITVSCAVVAGTSDDTSSTLFARSEQTLREAKRYGRNRTFVYEGEYPTPVVPPNFTLEERRIEL